jgi:hypothetical protein
MTRVETASHAYNLDTDEDGVLRCVEVVRLEGDDRWETTRIHLKVEIRDGRLWFSDGQCTTKIQWTGPPPATEVAAGRI